jgi:hypothetical protein
VYSLWGEACCVDEYYFAFDSAVLSWWSLAPAPLEAIFAQPEQPTTPQTNVETSNIPASNDLCRMYATPLAQAYEAALVDLYKQVAALVGTPIGPPTVSYANPIQPSDDPGTVPSWTICVPIVPTISGTPGDQYQVVPIAPLPVVRATCTNDATGRKACANLVTDFLIQNNYLTTGVPIHDVTPTGSFVFMVPFRPSS